MSFFRGFLSVFSFFVVFFSSSWRWVLVSCRSCLLTLGVSGGAARRRPRLVRRLLGAFGGGGEVVSEDYVKAGVCSRDCA
jgi:ABC-type multidrug transport system fused ATPase/permease subunit